ncbi:hypothetical protein [Microvirga aerophila]|uniref:Uncharacterized protein n=1 Tax=Microvirga aerophila TaxID=670291 RepID=A0A512C247_9HYPH|nr:hypothetical protein [Microvirga aerophila]GEO18290.1 hypothetical protein MAE02_59860 [Microvirga aerophila]
MKLHITRPQWRKVSVCQFDLFTPAYDIEICANGRVHLFLTPVDHSDAVSLTMATVAHPVRVPLKSAGLDFHALSDALSAEPEVIVLYSQTTRSEPELWDWREIARWCRDNDNRRLRPREREFVADIARHHTKPTKRQANWLRAIYTKLRDGGAR